MPLPVAAAPPVAGALYAGAAAASKHLLIHAAPLLDATASTLSYATVGVIIFRWMWKNKVPAWARDDAALRNLMRRKKLDPEEVAATDDENRTAAEKEDLEMANLSSILEKVKALVATVKLGSDHPSMLQQHAALLAYVQLCSQVKIEEMNLRSAKENNFRASQHDDALREGEKKDEIEEKWISRDSLYSNSHVDSPTIDSQYYGFAENPKESPMNETLQQALQFSAFAYYDDPEILSEKLGNHDCSLLEYSLVSPRPGCVAYYLAVSSISKNQLILGIRGTSSLEDIVTDCCGRSVPFNDSPYYHDHDRGSRRNRQCNFLDTSRIEVEASKPHEIIYDQEEVEIVSGLEQIRVEHGQVEGGKYHPFHCHEGCMVSAKRLVDTIQEQVEHWVLERGYQLVVTGHSLGAGVASLAAAILRCRLPELTLSTKGPPKMHVYCFAPPPILDRVAALAACSYTTSVVCNADIIPRCSMENLVILLETLKDIWHELVRQGLAPTGPKTTAAFFRRIANGSGEEMLMPRSSLRRILKESMEKVHLDQESKRLKTEETIQTEKENDSRDVSSSSLASSFVDETKETTAGESTTEIKDEETFHPFLYIPGVVLLGFEPWQNSSSPTETTSVCVEGDFEDLREAEVFPRRSHKWIVTTGTAHVLRFLEVDASPQMFMDHTTTSYYSLLDLEYSF